MRSSAIGTTKMTIGTNLLKVEIYRNKLEKKCIEFIEWTVNIRVTSLEQLSLAEFNGE